MSFQVRFPGTIDWMTVAGTTPEETASRAIYLHDGARRWSRNVRHVGAGQYRGLMGRQRSTAVMVREVAGPGDGATAAYDWSTSRGQI